MRSYEAVPGWLWRLANGLLLALGVVVLALAGALWLGAADPPRAGPLLWQDDFKSGLERWAFVSQGEVEAAAPEGALRISFGPAGGQVVGLTQAPPGDFTLEVAGTQVAGEPGAAYGLVFAWQDAERHTAVLVNGNGYAEAYAVAGGARQTLFEWGPWPHLLVPPESNRVRVDVRAGQALVRVNDEVLADPVPVPATGGRLGLVARSAGRSEVVFSWVRVWAQP